MKSPLNLPFLGAPLFLCLLSLKGINSQEGCFDRYQLSCQKPENTTFDGEVVEAQQICFELNEYYLVFDPLNLTAHAGLINEIPAESDLCNQVRQVYHLCYWCDLEPSSWCVDFYVRGSLSCSRPQDIDETVDVEATCEEAESLPQKAVWPATIALCYRLGQSYTTCTDCDNWEEDTPQEGCFDRYQVTCQPPENTTSDREVVDAQGVCSSLASESGYWNFLVKMFHPYLLNLIPADSDLCNQARQVFHLCFWCDLEKSSWCVNNLNDEEFASCQSPQELDDTVDREATCEEYQSIANQFEWPRTIDLCYRLGQSFHTCSVCDQEKNSGTSDDKNEKIYLGADTLAKKKALIWMSRSSAILAFFGASYIIWDTLHSRQNREKVYHQLMFGMACFDMCTALAWAFATAPIPKYGVSWKAYAGDDIYGAKGNSATCTAQGFFIQLGITSVFYNVTLSAYYVMVLVKNRTEQRLKRARWALHGVPLVVGFGLAFGGLPFYTENYTQFGCYGDSFILLPFGIIPIAISVVAITICMLRVYLKVRRQFLTSRRWRLGVGNADSLEKKVFWQCFSYILAFYITWPILFAGYIISYFDSGYNDFPYGLALTTAFVAPLQGFSNFLVYVRPRWQSYLENRKRNHGGMCMPLFSFLFYCRKEALATGSLPNSQPATRSVDPSVLIAERNETIQSQEEQTSVVDANSEEGIPVEEASDLQQPAQSDTEEEKNEDGINEMARIESCEEEKSYDDSDRSEKPDI